MRAHTLRQLDTGAPQIRIAATVPTLSKDELRNADLLGAQLIFARPLNAKQVAAGVRKLLLPVPVFYETPSPGEGPLAYPVRRNPD
jgi:hypothetical protein